MSFPLQRSTAAKREEKKIEKYRGEKHTSAISSPLVPLVFEHFGHWGNEGQKFLHQLSLRSRDDDGKANSTDFKAYWRRLMSVTLQRCNSSVISRKLDRILCKQDSNGEIYRNQINVH